MDVDKTIELSVWASQSYLDEKKQCVPGKHKCEKKKLGKKEQAEDQ